MKPTVDDRRQQINALAKTVASGARRLSWNLARTTPDAIGRTAGARHEQLKAQSEPYRRARSDHARIIGEITEELTTARRLAAGVARFRLEPRVSTLDQQYRDFLAQCRRDTRRSFPDEAFDHFRPPDMLLLAQYRETRRPTLDSAPVAVLLEAAQRALETGDAAGFVDLQLIEQRVARGPVSRRPEDLPIARELALLLEDAQERRVPFSIQETMEIEDAVEAGRRSISKADLVRLLPINTDHPGNGGALKAYEAEAGEYVEFVHAIPAGATA